MKKVYLSGPMSSLERAEYRARFARAEILLRERGYKVVNPAKFLICRWPLLYLLIGYHLTLLYDLWRLSHCNYIYMLPDWKESVGARIESFYAWNNGIYRLSESESRAINLKMAKWLDKHEQAKGSKVVAPPIPQPQKK